MPQIMTTREVAKYLKLHEITVCKYAKEGKIPAIRIGRVWRFDKDAIDNFIASQTEGLESGEKLLIPDKWTIVERHGNMATVTDGERRGRTPVKNHGIDFKCPGCGFYGPWDGVRCLSCGNLSDG